MRDATVRGGLGLISRILVGSSVGFLGGCEGNGNPTQLLGFVAGVNAPYANDPRDALALQALSDAARLDTQLRAQREAAEIGRTQVNVNSNNSYTGASRQTKLKRDVDILYCRDVDGNGRIGAHEIFDLGSDHVMRNDETALFLVDVKYGGSTIGAVLIDKENGDNYRAKNEIIPIEKDRYNLKKTVPSGNGFFSIEAKQIASIGRDRGFTGIRNYILHIEINGEKMPSETRDFNIDIGN